MISKSQLQRHASARPHVKDRIRTCVSQDRFEALAEHGLTVQTAQTEQAPLLACSEDTAERLRLLNAVNEESAVIRAGLNLCERIARALE